jgi:hypothetical protein
MTKTAPSKPPPKTHFSLPKYPLSEEEESENYSTNFNPDAALHYIEKVESQLKDTKSELEHLKIKHQRLGWEHEILVTAADQCLNCKKLVAKAKEKSTRR